MGVNGIIAQLSAHMDPTSPRPEQPELVQVEDILTTALRGWWLLAIFILLGALLGLGIHQLQPTVYETGYTILTSVDLTNTGEQTQFEEDLAMEAVGQVIASANLYDRVAAAAVKEGIQTDGRAVRVAASVERRMGTWRTRLRGSDPAVIERLAAIWQEVALADLAAAHQHALVADGLQRKQLSLEACLNQSTFSEPASGLCSPNSLRSLQMELRASARIITEERAASRGLTSGILIDLTPQPVGAAVEVLNRRGQMAAAGAAIGLIVGLWAMLSGLAARLLRGKRG
jgi:hypothetical protein